jgi:hypothetical protein
MAIKLNFNLFNNIYNLDPVINPNPLKAGKFAFTEDGLYSEEIFGPLQNNKCKCGKVFSRSNKGIRCDECNVLCDNKSLRSKTFARIDLPPNIYVVLPVFKQILIKIFGQTAVKSILSSYKYEDNKQKPYFFSLEENKLVKKSKTKKSAQVINFPVYDITTLHLLYKSMLKDEKYKDLIYGQMIHPDISKFVFVNFVVVTPPDSRPLAKLNDQYQAHPVSAAYTEILKNLKNSFLDKVFVSNSTGFGQTIYKYQSSIDKLYAEILDKNFQRKESIIRESLSGKTVETSLRAVIIPEPILSPGAVALHEETIKKVFIPELLHFLNEDYLKSVEHEESYSIVNFVDKVTSQIKASGDIDIPIELFKKFITEFGPKLRMLLERPPVLWRYNISGVLLELVYFNDPDYIGIGENRVTGVNTLIAAMFNMDYDGDSLAVYGLTSVQAKRDWNDAFAEKSIEFEHHRGLIVSPEHESIYCAYMLSKQGEFKDVIDQDDIQLYEGDLNDLKIDVESLKDFPDAPIEFEGNIYSYSTLAINVAINCNKIIYDGTYRLDKGNLNNLIKKIRAEVGDDKFYQYVHNFNKFLLETGTLVQYCNPTFDLDDFAISSPEIIDYKKTLIDEPYIAFHQNDILFKDKVTPEVMKNDENILGRVFASGARIKSVQLLKAVSNNGVPTTIYGKAFKMNIKNSLLDGLTKEEFFIGGDSARLALDQRQEAIPKGGELQRKFYYCTGFLYLSDDDDCGSTRGLEIEIENGTHLESLYGRYYMDGTEIDVEDKDLIGKTVTLRSTIFCKSKDYKMCTKCFGKKKPQSKALGASIGAFLSESIIQSVLRTHHFSGAFITKIEKELVEIIKSLEFQSPNFVKGSKEDIAKLENFMMDNYYKDGEIEFKKKSTKTEIVINELPFNDDSVKQLKNIVGMIDKARPSVSEDLISINDMYKFLLDNIVLPNGILSVYIELVISVLFFDEDDVMIRYSDKEPEYQIALKSVIDKLDPKLSIFHNFSNKAINRIYTSDTDTNIEHMYNNLVDCYQ